MNTLVQLLAVYTDPESNNAERYRQTDRRTDDLMMPVVCRAGQYDGLKGWIGRYYTKVIMSIGLRFGQPGKSAVIN